MSLLLLIPEVLVGSILLIVLIEAFTGLSIPVWVAFVYTGFIAWMAIKDWSRS